VDGRMGGHMDEQTDIEDGFIRSTRRRPPKYYNIILSHHINVYMKLSESYSVSASTGPFSRVPPCQVAPR